ncbi:MAG TPA: MOSC N-terminal beta barrel domain-containing protein [Candidatus Acidoferrum sp.]|nr:MOSC N-terminal beta barrel domain-containing protein [Candidatus Acidoferrum sp.]
MKLTVSEINVYPVKSLAGWRLGSAKVTGTGFARDREWMVVDQQGGFITQRQYPKMALIKPELSDNTLTLSAEEAGSVMAPIVEAGTEIAVRVWESDCMAIDQGDQAATWLSNYLGKPCRLVRMAPDFTRHIKEKYQLHGDESVGFADALPFLLVSEASLDDLNSKLAEPVPMNRFRPNIVVAGGNAFQEDTWKRIKIGEVIFRVVKPCARCETTTINQATGEKGIEPLETLGTYRTGPKGVMFGQNMVQENTGVVRVGDVIEVLE